MSPWTQFLATTDPAVQPLQQQSWGLRKALWNFERQPSESSLWLPLHRWCRASQPGEFENGMEWPAWPSAKPRAEPLPLQGVREQAVRQGGAGSQANHFPSLALSFSPVNRKV